MFGDGAIEWFIIVMVLQFIGRYHSHWRTLKPTKQNKNSKMYKHKCLLKIISGVYKNLSAIKNIRCRRMKLNNWLSFGGVYAHLNDIQLYRPFARHSAHSNWGGVNAVLWKMADHPFVELIVSATESFTAAGYFL